MNYRELTIDDLELLVKLRIRDLQMFSNQKIEDTTIQAIRHFYQECLQKKECHTLVGYQDKQILASATLYYYDILPNNENPRGKVGQITNVWVDENYRHQGIATYMIQYLIKQYRHEVGMICLNSAKKAVSLYQKIGFVHKDNYLIYKG